MIMSRPRVLIIQTGSALPEARPCGRDFDHWLAEGMGLERFEFDAVRVDQQQCLPAHRQIDAAVITGSAAMVSQRLDWSERTADWLFNAHQADVPMLGVCYGHQLLASALGGEVGPNPKGRYMGRVEVEFLADDDALLGVHHPQAAFHVSHRESVLRPPPGARVLGQVPHDPHHALHFGGLSWGVQFHPEFNRQVMRAYLEANAEALRQEGHDPDALIRDLNDRNHGYPLLQRFGDLVQDRVVAGPDLNREYEEEADCLSTDRDDRGYTEKGTEPA